MDLKSKLRYQMFDVINRRDRFIPRSLQCQISRSNKLKMLKALQEERDRMIGGVARPMLEYSRYRATEKLLMEEIEK